MTSRERAEKFLDALHFPHPEADDLRFDESSYVALTAALDAHAKEAVEAEREECAVVADSYQTDDWTTCPDRCVDHHNGHCSCIIVRRLATAIRARSEEVS